MLILGHNFWTRSARKLIKGSKDFDSSLVSNENLSETLWPSSWALGQATWAKLTLKLLHLWRQSQKILTPNQKVCTPQPKNVFRVQSTRLAVWALEQLSSAIGEEARALVRQPKIAVFRPKSKYEYIVHRLSKLRTRSAKMYRFPCFSCK